MKTFLLFNLFFASTAFARPEYAIRQKANCTSCHVLPMGAGPRLMSGKYFGSRSFPPADTSANEYFYGDFRAEYYRPKQDPQDKKNGLGLMVASVSAHVPIKSGTAYDTKYLGTFDMGAQPIGSREQTFLWIKKESSSLLPNQILFGKFYLPFGIVSDEHRTYVRMQNSTSFRDYDFGLLLGWDFWEASHVDLTITNGFAKAGAFTDQDETNAVNANLRINPPGPAMVGVSHMIVESVKRTVQPATSSAMYFGFDFSNLTKNWLQLTVLGEWQQSKGFNESNMQAAFFSTNSTFMDSVKSATSDGKLITLRWDLVDNFALTYKYDSLAFDKEFPGDRYDRTGYGFIWQFESNFQLIGRHEKPKNDRADLANENSRATQEVFFLMLRGWI
jgi:hypothetical protein